MKAVIVAARRTPIGSLLGAFQAVSAVELGTCCARDVLSGLDGADVADVIVGNVLQAGQGMNPARQIALLAGLPHTVPGQTVNRVCGSGLQAVVSAVHGLTAGDGALYLAGGTESMTQSPYLSKQMRAGNKFGAVTLEDSMLLDGLTDPQLRIHMGMTAENIADRYGITREEQDHFALESQRRASEAQQAGLFEAEIVAVPVVSKRETVLVGSDEAIRHDATLESLARLKPAFRAGGSVTAGNASGLNDGAAFVAVTTEEYARAQGLTIMAEILGYAAVGVDPAVMGIGPAAAVPAALKRARLSLADVDLFELNEAFAVQSIAVVRDLKLDAERVNIHGGALALGHPIGASGARVLVSLIHALHATGKEIGVASLCIGGGMGIAVVIRAV